VEQVLGFFWEQNIPGCRPAISTAGAQAVAMAGLQPICSMPSTARASEHVNNKQFASAAHRLCRFSEAKYWRMRRFGI